MATWWNKLSQSPPKIVRRIQAYELQDSNLQIYNESERELKKKGRPSQQISDCHVDRNADRIRCFSCQLFCLPTVFQQGASGHLTEEGMHCDDLFAGLSNVQWDMAARVTLQQGQSPPSWRHTVCFPQVLPKKTLSTKPFRAWKVSFWRSILNFGEGRTQKHQKL